MSSITGETSPAGAASGPWARTDHLSLAIGNVVGLVVVAVSWYQTAGASTVSTALSWFSFGTAGVVFAIVTNGLWLGRARRSIAWSRHEFVSALKGPALDSPEALAIAGDTDLVAVPDMTLFHRPDCPMVTGKPAVAASQQAHERSGLRPCPTCEP